MKKTTKSSRKFVVNLSHMPNILLVAIIVVLFGVSVLSSVYFRYKYVNSKNQFRSYKLQNWNSGDIINDDRFIFSFNSVREDDKSIANFWELPPSDKFVMVNLSYKNLMNIDYQMSPISSMHFETIDGTRYSVTSAPFIKDSLGGAVQNNITVRGEVGFTIPKNITSGYFIFDPGLIDAHQIRVRVSL